MPERQSAMCRAAASGSAKPSSLQLARRECRGRWTVARARPGARLSKICPARSTCGPQQIEQRGAARPARAAARHCRARPARPEAGASAHPRPSARDARSSAAADRLRRARWPFPRRAGPPRPAPSIASSVAGARTDGSRPPWIICWIWTKNSTSRIPPRPRFKIVAGADLRILREMVADPRGDLPHFLDHPEIERAAPHERLDRVEEALAERDVAGRGAGADERRALPRQSGRFIMRDRGVDRQRDRRDFGRRAEPQVDALDIAVGGPLLQQLDQPPADPDRRFAGILARSLRQASRDRTATAGRRRTNN